ncbi:MAG: homoserine O-acetyltransferase [Actinomycetaceae bacterium]|nr:homoserine O-acetyltransferase [Actinomycetaceae bacterium]
MSRQTRDLSATLPVTGGWREGDPVAFRKFERIGPLRLENGGVLPDVTMSYETFGQLNEDGSNAVLILHALTGDAHVTGGVAPGQKTAGWFSQIVGPGKVIDTRRYFVVAPNILGGCHGSTGPSSPHKDGKPWGSRFPVLSTRDQVNAEIRLTDALGIDRFHLVLGASMGGQRALEWAIMAPQRVVNLAVIASGPTTTADQSAWAHTQVNAVALDEHWHGGDYYDCEVGPVKGLGLARQIAHTTYRSAEELGERFDRIPQGQEDPLTGGRLAVQSYLDYHGQKLARRFDAGAYVALCRAMITHDIGRDRGGVSAALSLVRARTLVVAVDTDRLFSPSQSLTIATGVRQGFYREIRSDHGHDGFLIEAEQTTELLSAFLQAPRQRAKWPETAEAK